MELDDLRAAILRGDFDRSLVDIAAALNERMIADDGPIVRWRIVIDGQEMTEEDMTIAEAGQLERLTGNTWNTIQPGASAEITKGFLIVTLMRGGATTKDAVERVGKLTVGEAIDCVTRYQSDPPTSPADV